jgi:hypothetical protein
MPYTGGFPSATAIQTVRGRYDFAVDGGAVGSTNMSGVNVIPANAVILGGFVEVDTAFTTSASGTLAVNVEGAGDIVAAAIVSGAPWSTTGRKSVVPVFTGATTVKTTVARTMQATIATGALTAGAADVVLFYIVLPD